MPRIITRVKASVLQARKNLISQKSKLSLVFGAVLVLGWLAMISAAPYRLQYDTGQPKAGWFQQDTQSPTPTFTLSPTPSPSATQNLTLSPSATLTVSSTSATASITPTSSPIASSTATLTPPPFPPAAPSATWTLPYPSPLPPTAGIPGLLASPTEGGPTATLIPFPTVTFQLPGVTPRGDLLSLVQPTDAKSLPKGQSRLASQVGFGGWFIWLMLILWGGLVAWFVLTQIITRRQ
jgi:hypothetical protein